MTTARKYTQQIPLDKLVILPELEIFPDPDPDVPAGIAANMAADGYDAARPIVAWRHGGQSQKAPHVIVEGHTRYRAAQDTGQKTVTGVLRDFANLEEAQEYAGREQRMRRNLGIEQWTLSMIQKGRPTPDPVSAVELAARWKVGKATVERARALLKNGTATEIATVMEGNGGLERTYEASLARRRRAKEAEHAEVLDEPSPPSTTIPASLQETAAQESEEAPPQELTALLEVIDEYRTVLDDLDGMIDGRSVAAVAKRAPALRDQVKLLREGAGEVEYAIDEFLHLQETS